ncbi:MAG TPA: hypothetical protein VD735_05895 [Candidatus Saccharimonadales bacterium]|nr:hypothetical protein [Candidatus Saccharimonadales bacterium]
MNDIMLIVATLLPAALLVALRINAAMVFLSLCLGQVLVQFVAKDTDSLIRFIAPNAGSVSESTLYLVMLFLPVVLTCLIFLFSVSGRLKVTLNALPAIAVGALAVLLAVPLMTPSLQGQVQAMSYWDQLSAAQALIIGVGSLISLLLLWTARKGGHHGEAKHEKHGH